MHTQGRFINHTVCSLYRIMGTATSVVEGMNTEDIAPRAGIEPTYLAFQANVLMITPPRLPDVTTIPTPTCLYGSFLEKSVQTTTVIFTNI